MKKQRLWGGLALLCAAGLILALAAARTPAETALSLPAAGALTFDPSVAREDIDALTPLRQAALSREVIGPVTFLQTIPQRGGTITCAVSRDPDAAGGQRFRVVFLTQWERTGLLPWEETAELSWDPFFTAEGDSICLYALENRGGEGVFSPDESRALPTEEQNSLRRALTLTRRDRMTVSAVTLRESAPDGRTGTAMLWCAGQMTRRGFLSAKAPWIAYLSLAYES